MTLFGQIQVRSSGRRVRIERVGACACSGGMRGALRGNQNSVLSRSKQNHYGEVKVGDRQKKNPPVGGLVAM